MSASSVTIRTFTREDIPFGMELKNLAGWNQLPDDWERFVAWEPEGCFVAQHEGTDAGTAITINYDNRFGWVGMVLVHPDMRRKGIGTALLDACIDYLEGCGVDAVKLDATPMGKQLYDTIGFKDEYLIERQQATAPDCRVPDCIAPLTEAHLDAVLAMDFRAFGADRGRVIRALLADPGAPAFVCLDGGEVAGYTLGRRGMHADSIGPWCATGPDAALALLQAALAARAGKPVFMDISLANSHVLQMVSEFGFEKQRHLIRQFRGRNTSPGETGLVYAIAGPEIG
ncbi:MAG: GNAT family N-acetyltransferase [Armatimonadetes bacterium]|jgi:GNAT superfamily N-acetyltransferase|nr:GNAT family N-acetyltransferase [Armatimonadota bacterium]MDI9584099.1 GNAT family N-acetyltransferase [Acidobacteriota bacterium]